MMYVDCHGFALRRRHLLWSSSGLKAWPFARPCATLRLGLREPLAPIKPLAARGAVKAALAPPDNKAF